MYLRSIIVISILVLITGLTVNAYPSEAVCAVASERSEYSITQNQLLQQAKGRIEDKFGLMQSMPVIVFFNEKDSFWPLQLNGYGSTSFLGSKTCVLIGPKGHNVDVLAHELMHAETVHRIGYWQRWVELPIWFDEGLAMQVDHRERYNLPKDTKTSYVRLLNSVSDFAVSDSNLLVHHYASAKSEVTLWVTKIGADLVYDKLKNIKDGLSFDAIWQSPEMEASTPSSERSR